RPSCSRICAGHGIKSRLACCNETGTPSADAGAETHARIITTNASDATPANMLRLLIDMLQPLATYQPAKPTGRTMHLARQRYNRYFSLTRLNRARSGCQRPTICTTGTPFSISWRTQSLPISRSKCDALKAKSFGYMSWMVLMTVRPTITGLKVERSMTCTWTPLQGLPWYLENVGVKCAGRKRTPGSFFALSACASASASIQGAPVNWNGSVVPRPSDTLVPSTKPIPGYTSAVVSVGMLGDGITNCSGVSS